MGLNIRTAYVSCKLTEAMSAENAELIKLITSGVYDLEAIGDVAVINWLA